MMRMVLTEKQTAWLEKMGITVTYYYDTCIFRATVTGASGNPLELSVQQPHSYRSNGVDPRPWDFWMGPARSRHSTLGAAMRKMAREIER